MYSPTIILGMPGGWEIVLIIFVILLIFGGRKIPELMKGLGQGMKEFKKANKEDEEEKESTESKKSEN